MKIFKIIYYLFFACITIIAVFLVVSIFPITGNYKFLIVQSGSMEPAIHTGAIVIVKPTADYQVGDIITFFDPKSNKQSITHRIAEIQTVNGAIVYATKGDANNGQDQNSVESSRVMGKVIFNIPYLGYAVDAAKKPYGFAALIVLPALLIIFDEIKKIINEISRIRKNKKAGQSEAKEFKPVR